MDRKKLSAGEQFSEAREYASRLEGELGSITPQLIDNITPRYVSAWNALPNQSEGVLYWVAYYLGEQVPIAKLADHLRKPAKNISTTARRLKDVRIIKKGEEGFFIDDPYFLRFFVARNDPDWEKERRLLKYPRVTQEDIEEFITRKREQRAKSLALL